jgi:hypothetical protein
MHATLRTNWLRVSGTELCLHGLSTRAQTRAHTRQCAANRKNVQRDGRQIGSAEHVDSSQGDEGPAEIRVPRGLHMGQNRLSMH